MAYVTGTAEYVPDTYGNWYPDGYEDNGVPGTNVGDTHNCPWTGETSKRLTKASGATNEEHWTLEYTSTPHVSKDNTYVYVNNGKTNTARVINASTGALERALPSGTSLTGYWFDPLDDDNMYFVDLPFQKKIKKISISTGTVSTIVDLSSYTMTEGYSIDRVDVGECEISHDGRYISVGVNKNSAAANKGNLLIDLVGARVCGELYRADVDPDFFDASAYGEHGELYWKVAVIPGTGPTWWECWDANETASSTAGVATERWTASGLTQTTGLGTGHNALGTAPDGNHYFWAVDNYNNAMWRFGLNAANGAAAATKLWILGWFANAQTDRPNGIDEYFSAMSCSVNGWVYLSIWPGSWDGDPGLAWRKYMSEIIRFKWNGDETSIERIMHHRGVPNYPNYNSKEYWAYPRIGVSADDTRLVYNSNFRRPASDVVDNSNTDVYIHTISGSPIIHADRKYRLRL